MSHLERLGRMAQQGQGLRQAQGLVREALSEILALQPLHGEEGLALLGEAVGDIGDDAGVVQRSTPMRPRSTGYFISQT